MEVKHIIFDLGNVICRFDADAMLAHFFPAVIRPQMKAFFFESGLWNEYDRGAVQKEDLIKLAVSSFPQWEPEITAFLQGWTRFIFPLQANVELMKQLKEKGYGIYVLSNLSEDAEALERDFGVFDHISGAVFSWREKLVKPDPAIYQLLLSRYGLDPATCLFLDDNKINVQAARELGIWARQVPDVDALAEVVGDLL